MKIHLIRFIYCFVIIFVCHATSRTATAAVAILPLGDSITQGNPGRFSSYRPQLVTLLDSSSLAGDWQWIGSLTDGAGLRHEGHSGWTSRHIREGRIINGVTEDDLESWLQTYTPDLVLYHIGTNDILFRQNGHWDGDTTQFVIGNINSAIELLQTHNPDVVIFLAQIIPAVFDDRFNSQHFVEVFNDRADILNQAIAMAPSDHPEWDWSNVHIVDQNTDFAGSADGIHTDETGAGFMAERWFAALKEVGIVEGDPAVDSDGDGVTDDLDSFPNNPDESVDTDGDGMGDNFENTHGLDLNDAADAPLDLDSDGLTNLQEFTVGTEPDNVDTDGDGMWDGFELEHDFDPLDANDAADDPDGDGLSNLEEFQLGTDPNVSNTDPPVSVHYDFNGDKIGDILWRHSSAGRNVIWFMNADGIIAHPTLSLVPSVHWKIACEGDFDGNGVHDILWRHDFSGKNVLYLMDESGAIAKTRGINVVEPVWDIVGCGDLDADGKADILWHHNQRGDNWLYTMDAHTIVASQKINRTGKTWQVVGIGDADADGREDIFWRNRHSGVNWLYRMQGKAILASKRINQLAGPWAMEGVGDFNGDRRIDLLWHNTATGENRMYLMDGEQILADRKINIVNVASSWHIAQVSDLTGDGKADIFWRNTHSGKNLIYKMDANGIVKVLPMQGVADTRWEVRSPR